jgi:hypothetical protein
MDYIEVPLTAQFDMFFSLNGQQTENVLHYSKPTEWTAATLQEAAVELIQWWDVNVQPLVSSGLILTAVKATALYSQTGPSIVTSLGLPLAGTVSGQVAPNNVALAITKRTALRGRSYRGRLYHMGIAVAQINGQQIQGATAGSLYVAYLNALSLALTAEAADMVVVSRYFNKNPRAVGVATPVTDLTINLTLDSQRRRLPERGG